MQLHFQHHTALGVEEMSEKMTFFRSSFPYLYTCHTLFVSRLRLDVSVFLVSSKLSRYVMHLSAPL